MCEITPRTTPIGSNEALYGRTDTKSPMVYSSMVHVAGGEGGSTRHDDDGRPAPSGSAVDRAGQSKDWMGDWKTSMAAPASAAATWGPYFDAEFGPPHRVRAWIAWKISSMGVNIARRWWDQREELRAASIHVAL